MQENVNNKNLRGLFLKTFIHFHDEEKKTF